MANTIRITNTTICGVPINAIPINWTMFKPHKKDAWLFIQVLSRSAVAVSMNGITISTLNFNGSSLSGLCRKTYMKIATTYTTGFWEGKTAFITEEAINNVRDAVSGFTAVEKSGIVWMYCYITYQCWCFQDFCRSEANIAAELQTSIANVSRYLKFLIDNQLIYIKRDYCTDRNNRHARTYQLNRAAVPDYYATKWWFAGNLHE